MVQETLMPRLRPESPDSCASLDGVELIRSSTEHEEDDGNGNGNSEGDGNNGDNGNNGNGNSDDDAPVVRLPSDKNSSNVLAQDNDRLRRRVKDLELQMTMLRQQLQQPPTGKSSSSSSNHGGGGAGEDQQPQNYSVNKQNASCAKQQGAGGVILEFPKSIRANHMNSGGAPHERNPNISKDHQSFSTEDGQETVEPWEMQQELGGLKHRCFATTTTTTKAVPGSPKNRRQTSPNGSSPTEGTRKTARTVSSNDGSLSSNYDDDDFDDEAMDEEAGRIAESRDLLSPSSTMRMDITDSHEPNSSTSTTTPTDGEEETFWQSLSDRARWLVGLLVLQSMSSFILARNEALLQEHSVIVRFLTMLVGAGGNAGNQASVRVIRGLAVGTINPSNRRQFLRKEFTMGVALSIILGTTGCIRAAIFLTPWLETIAITTSLFMIVAISIVLGALMPIGMNAIGIDPAHSSTTIQVVMDILGVSITLWMSQLVLESGFHTWLLSMTMGDVR